MSGRGFPSQSELNGSRFWRTEYSNRKQLSDVKMIEKNESNVKNAIVFVFACGILWIMNLFKKPIKS
jgi:hypothetical protein